MCSGNRFREIDASPLLIALLITSLALPADAGLYRWIDEDGKVTYSDRVPPHRAGGGHAELNRRGIQVREVDPARSREELAREKAREAELRAEQARMAQQREADAVLLRSFPVEEDILMARDGKLAALDTSIKVLSQRTRRLKRRLLEIHGNERTHAGGSLAAQKTTLRSRLVATYRKIMEEQAQKQTVRNEYDGYLRRYRKLKGLRQDSDASPRYEADLIEDPVSAIACETGSTCAGQWARAVAMLESGAEKPVAIDDASLVMTAPPASDTNVGLTLALDADPGAGPAWILLELECGATPAAVAACRNAADRAARLGFSADVSGDAPHAAQTEPVQGPPTPAPAG